MMSSGKLPLNTLTGGSHSIQQEYLKFYSH